MDTHVHRCSHKDLNIQDFAQNEESLVQVITKDLYFASCFQLKTHSLVEFPLFCNKKGVMHKKRYW